MNPYQDHESKSWSWIRIIIKFENRFSFFSEKFSKYQEAWSWIQSIITNPYRDHELGSWIRIMIMNPDHNQIWFFFLKMFSKYQESWPWIQSIIMNLYQDHESESWSWIRIIIKFEKTPKKNKFLSLKSFGCGQWNNRTIEQYNF